MKIKKAGGGDWLWIHFKYERLPSFCFYCGILGHLEKFCEALFDNPQAGETRKYDSSLRAPIRRLNTSKDNQLFRDASGGAVNQYSSDGYGAFPVEKEDKGVMETNF